MTGPRGPLQRAKCRHCGRSLAVQPPARGDGSVDVFPRHHAPGLQAPADHCKGSRAIVPAGAYMRL